jgi:P4 family phage/plasmid primase-like protien
MIPSTKGDDTSAFSFRQRLSRCEDEIVRLIAAVAGASGKSPPRMIQPPYMKLYGEGLICSGFSILPVRRNKKAPQLDGWRNLRSLSKYNKLAIVRRHTKCSIGLDTALTPAFDIDCDHADVVEQLRAEILLKFGGLPERLGRSPRIAMLFKAHEPFKKVTSATWVDEFGEEQKVEFLGNGQQVVIYGYHPDTHLPYTWYKSGDPFSLIETHPDELPLIDVGKARALCNRFDELARAKGWERAGRGSTIAKRANVPSGTQSKLPIANDELKNAVMMVKECDDYNSFVLMGMAISHQTDGSEEGLDIWEDWASQSAKYSHENCLSKWKSFSNDREVGVTARYIFKLAGIALPGGHGLSLDDISEDRVAAEFAERYGDDFRYDHTPGKWFHFDGSIWAAEQTELAIDHCRQLCRELRAKADDARTRNALSRGSASTAVERLARTDRAFAVTSQIWDRSPLLLGTPGGTVDLRTGVLRPACRQDYITMSTAVAPLASVSPEKDMPVFHGFLSEVTSGDNELTRYLQQWGGYCLTGETREQVLLFIHGPGGNGKSVFQSILAKLLGSYAWAAPPEMFISSRQDRHPTEMAALRGKRLVTASENESGRAWAEVRIKQLTGGDQISARFMRQDFFTFDPVAKFFFVGNNKPHLNNVDEAMRRRFHILEFNFKPTEPDKHLFQRLEKEGPAILRWFIDGCLDWQKNGFVLPVSLRRATDEYFAEQDIAQQWIDECCDLGPKLAATNKELRESFESFAAGVGRPVELDILENLRKKAFKAIKNTSGIRGRGYLGIKPRDNY